VPVTCGKDEKSGAAEKENPGECVKVLKQYSTYIVQGLSCPEFAVSLWLGLGNN
jgi:hypothetical protein